MRTSLLFFLLLAGSVVSAQVNLNSGLVANFPLNGSAADASGNGHNGSIQGGAAFTTDRFGNANSALSFDGIDDYVQVADNGAFATGAFSLSFWFTTDRNSQNQVPVGKRDIGPSNNSEFGLNLLPASSGSNLNTFLVSDNKPCSAVGGLNDYYNFTAPLANYCTNRWYHVVVTFSNGTERIYLDGQLKNTGTAPFTGKSNCLNDLRFGMWWSGDPNWFRGKLDDIRWYNRELSAAEVFALYATPVAPPVQANCASCATLPQAGISGSTLCGTGTGTLTFTATAGTLPYTVTISDGSNTFTQLVTGNSATIPVAAVSTTTYTLVSVKDATGCERSSGFSSGSASVTFNPKPVITTSPAAPAFCPGDSVQLTATGGGTYAWTPATGLSNAAIANPKAAPAATTTYKLVVSSSAGCKDSVNVTVTRNPAAVATASAANASICQGDTTQLTATGGGTYAWTPAATLSSGSLAGPRAYPLATTNYKVVVTNGSGCKDSTLTTITVNPRPVVNLGPDTVLCTGSTLSLNAATAGATGYTWSNGSSSATTVVSGGGTYSVAVQVAGCLNPARDTIVVTQGLLPTVTLGADRTLCANDQLQLSFQGTNYSSFAWSTGSTATTLTVTAAGSYAIRVQNSCGVATDTVNVQMQLCDEDLYFPTAFTPNHDGRNDGFKALHAPGVTVAEYRLSIYNRWGNRVFTTNYLEAAWGGTLNGGDRQGINTFVFYAEYRFKPGGPLIKKKGTFVLLR